MTECDEIIPDTSQTIVWTFDKDKCEHDHRLTHLAMTITSHFSALKMYWDKFAKRK